MFTKKEMPVFQKQLTFVVFVLVLASCSYAAIPYEGYTVFASGQYVYIVDMSGNELHSWKSSNSVIGQAYLLQDGSVLFPSNNRCSVRRDGMLLSGRFEKISWDGTVTWDYTLCDETFTPGYDIEPMPNGNVLIPADNANSAGAIFEVKPSGKSGGEIVWQYNLPDSLNERGTYINSISYNPALDMILVNLQEPVRKFVVIDHRGSGSIAYTCSIGNSGRVHGAMWVSKYFIGTDMPMPDADSAAMRLNNLLVVNNTEQVVEVSMTTKSIVKTIPYPFTNHEGSVQRLPNGNTLVHKGMSQTTINELDENGSIIATITAKRCARAYRYGLNYPGVSTLNPTAVKTHFAKEVAQRSYFNAAIQMYTVALRNPDHAPVTVKIVSLDGKTLRKSVTCGTTAKVNTTALKTGMYFIDVTGVIEPFRKSFIKAQ